MADMEYTIRAAKANLSRLIKKVVDGEEVIITRGKKPVVRLVPFETKRKRVPRGI